MAKYALTHGSARNHMRLHLPAWARMGLHGPERPLWFHAKISASIRMCPHGPAWTRISLHGPAWTQAATLVSCKNLHINPDVSAWTRMDPHQPAWTRAAALVSRKNLCIDPELSAWTRMDPHGPAWTRMDMVPHCSAPFHMDLLKPRAFYRKIYRKTIWPKSPDAVILPVPHHLLH